jgi:hypothetical protein
MAIIIGKAHPVLNKMKGMQNYNVQFNSSFFDGLYYLKSPNAAQKSSWKSGALSYGVYTEANIPFLLISFTKDKWNFLTPLNSYTANENDRKVWIDSKENVLNLFLLNADTNITEEIRTLKVDAKFSTLVRTACKAQLAQYKTAAEVDAATQKIIQTKNFLQMQQAAYMVTIMTI